MGLVVELGFQVSPQLVLGRMRAQLLPQVSRLSRIKVFHSRIVEQAGAEEQTEKRGRVAAC